MPDRARLHPLLAALPLGLWTVFHLWEQWSAFGGREAWLARMRQTSGGTLATLIELVLVVVPLAVWAGLAIADLVRRRPLPGAAREGDPLLAAALGRAAPFATIAAIAFVAIHVAHLWGPKLVRGASELETWSALTHDLGTAPMLAIYAIGLTAVAIHLAVAIPAALESLGWIARPPARTQALLVSTVFALCAWVLAAQLFGWLATGHGTFWSIEVIES